MADRDQEMLDYIDDVIVDGRTSDAAEDSAGAAWAAYKRGELDVPAWYRKEHRSRRSTQKVYQQPSYQSSRSTPPITWDTFLRSMGILFLVLIAIVLFATLFS